MTTTWKNICALITDPHLTQKTNASAEMVTQTASQHRGLYAFYIAPHSTLQISKQHTSFGHASQPNKQKLSK